MVSEACFMFACLRSARLGPSPLDQVTLQFVFARPRSVRIGPSTYPKSFIFVHPEVQELAHLRGLKHFSFARPRSPRTGPSPKPNTHVVAKTQAQIWASNLEPKFGASNFGGQTWGPNFSPNMSLPHKGFLLGYYRELGLWSCRRHGF